MNTSTEQEMSPELQLLFKHKDELINSLQVQIREAEMASESKSIFLANMSHEIRTPLNAILGYAQIMEHDKTLSPSSRRAVETINTAGQHLLELIGDVLDLTKIEAGKMELNLSTFDLSELLDGVSTMVEIRCKQKNLEWHYKNHCKENLLVRGDKLKLRQILINLLGNATKFTETGSVSLKVDPVGEDKYWFHVIDTGLGIADEDRETIFDAFQQEDAGKKSGGTGLGLSITTRQIELMGGALMMKSVLGEGSHFSITMELPAVEDEKLAMTETDGRIIGLKPGCSISALVVDDVADNRHVLTQVLEMAGVTVSGAATGEDGVMKALSELPDVVFMDLELPGIDGHEARLQIANQLKDRCPTIIAFSAATLNHELETCIEEGFDEFLRKPIQINVVYQMLRELVAAQFEYEKEPNAEPEHQMRIDVGSAPAHSQLKPLRKVLKRGDVTAALRALEKITISSEADEKWTENVRRRLQRYDISAALKMLE